MYVPLLTLLWLMLRNLRTTMFPTRHSRGWVRHMGHHIFYDGIIFLLSPAYANTETV